MKRHLGLFVMCSVFILLGSIPTVESEDENGEKNNSKGPAEKQILSKEECQKIFAKLFKLGLPSVKDLKYVFLESFAQDFNSRRNIGYYQYDDAGLDGNSWLISENPDGSADFVANQVCKVRVFPLRLLQPKVVELEKKLKRQGKTNSGIADMISQLNIKRLYGRWRPVDLEHDAKAIVRFVEKIGKVDYINLGGYLIFAAHIFQHGYTQEAIKLTNLLAGNFGKEKIVNHANGMIAGYKYNMIYREFIRCGDWEQYYKRLKKLLDRFSGQRWAVDQYEGIGWTSKEELQDFLSYIKARIDGKVKPPKELTPEYQIMATELLNATYFHDDDTSWLLAPPESKCNDIISKIQRQGIDALPLLLALLNDQNLTNIKIFRQDPMKPYPQPVSRAYGFRGPWTRGEVAFMLLGRLITEDTSGTVEERISFCRNWVKKLKGKQKNELFDLYWKESDEDNNFRIINSVLESGDKQLISRLPRLLKKVPDSFEKVKVLLKCLKNNHKNPELITMLNKILREPQKYYSRSDLLAEYICINPEDGKKIARELGEEFKYLEGYDPEQTAEEFLSTLLIKNELNDNNYYILWKKLNKETKKHTIELILNAVSKTSTKPNVKVELLKFIWNQAFDRMFSVNRIFLTPETINLWRKILSDDSIIPPMKKNNNCKEFLLGIPHYWGEGEGDNIYDLYIDYQTQQGDYPIYGLPNIKTIAAILNELLYGNHCGCASDPHEGLKHELGKAASCYGIRMYDFYVHQALKRLDGKWGLNIWQILRQKNLSDKQKKSLLKKFNDVTITDVPKLLQKLSMSEYLSLPDLVENNLNLNKKLHDLAYRITEISINMKVGGDEFKKFEKLKGQELTIEVVEEIISTCAAFNRTYKNGVVCDVRKKPMLEGVIIIFTENPETWYKVDETKGDRLFQAVIIYGSEKIGIRIFMALDNKQKPKELKEKQNFNRKLFREKLQRFCNEYNSLRYGGIHITKAMIPNGKIKMEKQKK